MGKKKPITIDIWSVIKKRLHLIKIGILPLIFIFIGGGILTKTSQLSYLSDKDYLLNNFGLIIGLIGVIWLIVVYIISGKKTFNEWKIAKKQKSYVKNQRYPKTYKILFVILVAAIITKVYLRGIEGYQEVSSFSNWAIIIAVIWSVVINIKSKIVK
ncbi:hypothetical protein HOF78_02910 [Candidatus Woesearchaeota archaeon]|jgi:hypothetical protein|nr:hypothetical protein [Candidatus Woesearchaeota archaeon]MBT6044502.1 hypothetical protein [Candidatus Woesearchaeota archaeon]